MTDKLKPCPFCGGEAEISEPSRRYLAFIACSDDDCAIVTKGYGTVPEAIAAWNRRTNPETENYTDDSQRITDTPNTNETKDMFTQEIIDKMISIY